MRILIIALLALVAAIAAGNLVAEDPGFVVIGYGGTVVRTTFAFFMVIVFISVIVGYSLVRLIARTVQMRQRWRRWRAERRRQRAHRSLADGMLALASGEFSKAERLFSKGVDDDNEPQVHYLAAAQAAQSMKAPGRRDNYLRLARESDPASASAFDLKQAEWLLDNNQVDEADATLLGLASREATNPQFLYLRMRLYQARGDYRALLGLIPELRGDRVLHHDEIDALEKSSALKVLASQFSSAEPLKAEWESFSRTLRSDPEMIAAYASALSGCAADDEAEAVLRKRLERVWDSRLAETYGEISCEPVNKQLRRVESWSMTRGEDPGLRLTRARLAVRSKMWGLAAEQLHALMAEQGATPLHYRLLAEVADGRGDNEQAARLRATGLSLATGEVIDQSADVVVNAGGETEATSVLVPKDSVASDASPEGALTAPENQNTAPQVEVQTR